MLTNENPSSKRQRISKACETCRRRKSKCDGTQPICAVCSRNRRTCTYENSNRKRGLQVGYVRTIETLLGLLVDELPDAEIKIRELLRSANIKDKFSTCLSLDSIVEAWHRSKLHEDVEYMLKHHEIEDGVNVAVLPSLADQRRLKPTCSITSTSTPITVEPSQSIEEQPIFDINEDMAELVDWYFTYLHCWFPVVTRRDILHVLHSSTDHEHHDSVDNGHKACLFSIVALTFILKNKNTADQARIEQMLRTASTKIIEADHNFELGHIQALFVLILAYITIGRIEAAWIKLGQVSRMLVSYLGNGLNCANRLPHILQTYECLDVMTSALLGKPVSPMHMSLPAIFVDEEGAEEWEGWRIPDELQSTVNRHKRTTLRALSIFNQTTQLMRQIRPVLSSKPDEVNVRTVLADLAIWKNALPSHCNIAQSMLTNPCLIGLSLTYNFALISVLLHTGCPATEVMTAQDAAQSILNALNLHTSIAGFSQPLLSSYASHTIQCLHHYQVRHHNSEIKQLLTNLHISRTLFDLRLSAEKSLQSRKRNMVRNAEVTTSSHQLNHFNHTSMMTQIPPLSSYNPEMLNRLTHLPLVGHASNSTMVSLPSKPHQQHHDSDPLEIAALDRLPGHAMEHGDDTNNLPENEFDYLLDEIPLDLESMSESSHNFAYNLGFLTQDLNSDFLSAFELATYSDRSDPTSRWNTAP